LIYNSGGGTLSRHFIWKVSKNFAVEDALTTNQQVIEKLKPSLPVYHTRAMRREFINAYGHFTANTTPYILRSISLTGDVYSSRTTDETAIDQRLKQAIENEDLEIYEKHMKEESENMTLFGGKCNEYLQGCNVVPAWRSMLYG